MEALKSWLEKKLDELIEFPASPDLINYILEMENPLDIEHYFQSLLDVCNTRHRQFIQEYVQRRAKLVGVSSGYKKRDVEEDYIAPMKNKNKKENNENATNNVPGSSSENVTGKKKSKQAKGPKERRRCDCEASEHKLINNCLKCGRIVCSIEGSGPCLFCGELVCSREERRLIEQSDQGDTLYQKLMDRKVIKGLEEAIKNRDRLVDFDRNCEQRTVVIDDAHDYFCDNSVWLTKEERDKIAKKQEELDRQRHSRLGPRKITIDFAGREIREEKNIVDTYSPDVLNDIVTKATPGSQTGTPTMSPRVTIDVTTSGNIALESKILSRGTGAGQQGILSLKFPQSSLVGRVQDRGLQEMTDVGACLSIHQPWATLLVKGIKKEEGRTWYTPHRGKLWIASTSKQCTPEDLKLAKSVYGEENFPTKLPSGCLLGCVLLVDCLPQEEYRERCPQGVDDSPYVFMCESPLELAIQFPMKGKPNIYKLDPKIHFAAQSNLSKSYAKMATAS
uniref:Activating signal cointegrator 1 n=1 Tax=Cacopsylla melanoneura TaxID=428564 RepID=A0A8D8YRY8_9HEMI